MHRFFLDASCISTGEVIFPEKVAHQLFRVLRLRPGTRVIVLDDLGSEFEVELTEVTARRADGKINFRRDATGEPDISLRLLLCMSQREKFEWMLQKCTEVGVSAFVPLISERSLVQDVRSIDHKMERWANIVREAAEQCGRGKVPLLEKGRSLEDAVKEQGENTVLRLVPWEREDETMLHEALVSLQPSLDVRHKKKTHIDIMIGPEGGFSEKEVRQAVAHGFQSVSMGKRIYRMETAAVVAAALVIYEYERNHPAGSSPAVG